MFGDCFNKNSELSYFKFPQKVLSTTKYEMKDHINNKENNAYNSNISRAIIADKPMSSNQTFV